MQDLRGPLREEGALTSSLIRTALEADPATTESKESLIMRSICAKGFFRGRKVPTANGVP